MFKRLVLVVELILISTVCYAGQMRVESLKTATDATSFSVPGPADSVYTRSFPIKSGEYFGLGYQAISHTGTPKISIELEQSYRLPSTEGAEDDYFVEPDNMSDVATGVTTETYHYVSFSPVPTPYARFRFKNNGGTNDTVVTGQLIVIEED